MDVEKIVDDTLAAETPETVWHPVLQTERQELIGACVGSSGGYRHSKQMLVAWLVTASEEEIGLCASKLGDRLMDGSDYWEAIPYAVESVMPE